MGYVPAELALHENLTVAETMQDAARLRLPRKVSSQDRKQRVQTVLQTVGLTQLVDKRVSLLNEVDRRKLSIAVELIGYPKLLLLDQAADPLTPFDEVQISLLARDLARQGITVIYVNPRSRSGGLADKIVFLAPGGLMAWFGPSKEAFTYLKRFLPRGVIKDMFGLHEALEMLVNPQEAEGVEWAKRFRDSEAYQAYVDDPLNNRYPDLMLQTRPLLRLRLRNSSKEKQAPPIFKRASLLQKFSLLNKRTSRVLRREGATVRMLVIPALVALVYAFLSSMTAQDAGGLPVPGLLVFLILLTSAFLFQTEISRERVVYQREDRISSMLIPYVLSKVWRVGGWAIYQGVIWAIAREPWLLLTGGVPAFLSTAILFILTAFLGGILGLIVSALSRTTTTAAWVLLLIVPLVLFLFDPLSHLSKLAAMSLLLILILMWIQRRASSVRT
jgi:ABC-type multidrug transport system ATPase subunit